MEEKDEKLEEVVKENKDATEVTKEDTQEAIDILAKEFPAEDLSMKVSDEVKTREQFGKLDAKMKGVGGTLHLTEKSECDTLPSVAWDLSKATGKPVIIVVRAK